MSLWIERAASKVRQALLLERTSQLLATAQAGTGDAEFTLIMGEDGGLFISTTSDWPLDRLLAEREALAAWRISRTRGLVRIEGLNHATRWRLEAPLSPVSPDPPRARTALIPRAGWG